MVSTAQLKMVINKLEIAKAMINTNCSQLIVILMLLYDSGIRQLKVQIGKQKHLKTTITIKITYKCNKECARGIVKIIYQYWYFSQAIGK